MKKMLSLLLALVLVLMLCACGKSPAAETEAPTQAPTEAAQVPAEETPEEAPEESAGTETQPVVVRAPEDTWDYSAEIVTMIPAYGLYTKSDLTYGEVYTELVCKCGTAAGETFWLYLSSEDYTACFNPDTSIASAQFAYSDMVAFANPIRIDGAVTAPETLTDDLAGKLDDAVLVTFGDFQVTDQPLTESAYTADVAPMTCVNASIVSIEPGYSLNNGVSLENTDVVCKCETADGNIIWVAMPIATYNEKIDPEASLAFSGLMSFETVTYSPVVTFHGVAIEADSVASGLQSAIGCNTVLCFSSMD